MEWRDFISHLRDLAGVLGSTPLVVLLAVAGLLLLAVALMALYMILRFGESGLEMFVPFLREALKELSREVKKEHRAIRMERRFHYFFGLLTLFTLAGSLLHSLIPWVNHENARMFMDAFITSTVVCVVLLPISLGLCLRLK